MDPARPTGGTNSPEGGAARPAPDGGAPPAPANVWAYRCPSGTCDTELVILPEQEGQWVECPTCGHQFIAPHLEPAPPDASGPAAPEMPAPPKRPTDSQVVGWLVGGLRPPRPTAGQGTAKERTSAAEVLEMLARQAQAPGVPVAPARPAPEAPPRHHRRPAVHGPQYTKREVLTILWIAAAAICGIGVLAAAMVGAQVVALAAVPFVAMAVLWTIVIIRRKKPPA